MNKETLFRNPNQDPNAEEIRVTSRAGHIARVGREWRTLPDILHAKAMSLGCECSKGSVKPINQVRLESSDAAMETGSEVDRIKAAVKLLMVTDPDAFGDEGELPSLQAISQSCGFSVEKADVITAMQQIKDEATTIPPPRKGARKVAPSVPASRAVA